jgi:hypothetical protein
MYVEIITPSPVVEMKQVVCERDGCGHQYWVYEADSGPFYCSIDCVGIVNAAKESKPDGDSSSSAE